MRYPILLGSLFWLLAGNAMAAEQCSVGDTKIAVLMAHENTRPVLEKFLPKTTSNPKFKKARKFTLTFIAKFDKLGELTEENLKKIDGEISQFECEK